MLAALGILLASPQVRAQQTGPPQAAGPAAGGAPLLVASETAVATVVGVIRTPTAVDRHGYEARLRVDRVLTGALETGGLHRIAWEELARGRPARFQDGERVLVALEPLPRTTLWRARFPDGEGYAVADRGEAFLRNPDSETIDALAAFLALGGSRREHEPGVAALARTATRADPVIAAAALERLRAVPELGGRLSEPAVAELGALLADDGRPESLRRALLALAADRSLAALRPAVLLLDRPSEPLRAAALDALAAIDGGLEAARIDALLEASDPTLRAAGVRHAVAPRFAPAVARLAGDPDPRVRAAAVARLIADQREEAIDLVSPALFDPDPTVREAAVRGLGELGAASVPALERIALAHPSPGAAAPLASLTLAGPEGRSALERIAAGHSDEKTRALARTFLGRAPFPSH